LLGSRSKRKKILDIKNLKKYFSLSKKQIVKAVDDVSLEIYEGNVGTCWRIWFW
jgi:ABC-type oligopeptide transport system ATPase subunit